MLKAESTDDVLVIARFRALMSRVPYFAAGVCSAMVTRIVAFSDYVDALWTIATSLSVIAVMIFIMIEWWRSRTVHPDPNWVRRRLMLYTMLTFIVGGPAIVVDLVLVARLDGFDEYFIVLHLAFTGICFCVLLSELGRIALVFSFTLILLGIVGLVQSGIPHSTFLAVEVAIFSVGTVLAMRFYSSRFDRLLRTQAKLEKLNDSNARLANSDILTGLANRRRFFEVLDRCSLPTERGGRPFLLGLIDLDGFKSINDGYGHKIGDQVLVESARRLEAGFAADLSFFRLGGDEFAFIATAAETLPDPDALGAALIAALERPIVLGDLAVSVSCSIGMVTGPEDEGSAHTFYEHADFALYHSKRAGRGRATLFSSSLEEVIRSNGAIEKALRSADLASELRVVFQPIVNVSSGSVIAMECLARWESPTLGPVSPATFVPIAERIGAITPITFLLLEKAVAGMRSWPASVELSFNLSAYDIMNSLTVRRLIRMVGECGLDPGRFAFEITETALVNDFAIARDNVILLRNAGMRVVLDDFGTGYSSLSHVQSLPLDKLKIDRRFITDIETNPTSQTIVRSLVALCHGVGIGCVAEGAETAGQIAKLTELGCRDVQGYFYSKPMTPEAAARYLATGDAPGLSTARAAFR